MCVNVINVLNYIKLYNIFIAWCYCVYICIYLYIYINYNIFHYIDFSNIYDVFNEIDCLLCNNNL